MDLALYHNVYTSGSTVSLSVVCILLVEVCRFVLESFLLNAVLHVFFDSGVCEINAHNDQNRKCASAPL